MIDAYLAAGNQVAGWFAGPWQRPEDRVAHARALAETWDRPALVAILDRALSERAAPRAARDAAARLAQAGCVAVVSGQQPAVGGGPLYTLVKAAHSLAVAAELEAHGVPAVAVFWCACEDHDHGEAGHADLLQRDGSIQRVHATLPVPGASLHFQPASAWWEPLLDALQTLPGCLGAAWWRELAPHGAEDMGHWTCRLLDALFGARGLVAIQAHHLRGLVTGGIARALDTWPQPAIAARNAELTAAGLDLPLGPLDAPPLFADRPEGRRAVDPDAAWRLLATEPERLSPGAGLRPVLQQLALPTAVYCAGPGEIAYHAQLGPVYVALQAQAPLLLPRIGVTLVPSWLERACAAWELTPEQVLAGVPVDDGHAAPELLAGLDHALRELEHRLRSLDQDTARRVVAGHRRLQRERDRLAESLARGRRQGAGRHPLGALRAWLLPRGQRQERSMSLAQAIWEHGPGLADRLAEAAIGVPPGEHLLLRLAAAAPSDGARASRWIRSAPAGDSPPR